MLLRDIPVEDFAEASNTTLSVVVKLEYFLLRALECRKPDLGAFLSSLVVKHS